MGFFLDNGVCRCIYPKKDKEGDFFLGWNSLSQRHRIQSTECRVQSTECRVQSAECRVQSTEYRHTEMAWHAVLGNGDDEEEMLWCAWCTVIW